MLLHTILTTLLLPLANHALAVTSSTATTAPMTKSYLITGANKGQGLALCRRILAEHDDTHVFLCSRDVTRGEEAKLTLLNDATIDERRVDVIQLDVTSDSSVNLAVEKVQSILSLESSDRNLKLCGLVSNAGILWGYPLPELLEVCTTGVKRVLDAFVPLLEKEEGDDGRVIVVTSGLGPLMHQYSGEEHQSVIMSEDCDWDDIYFMMKKCLDAYHESTSQDGEDNLAARIEAFKAIHFPGGPFADTAPDFHMYGLAKMFGDAYMKVVARRYPSLRVNSVDPGLVYTDLILRMPKYAGKEMEETTAQSPHEGVEATMRLLFDKDAGKENGSSGMLYAMNKEKTKLLFSDVNKMPQKQ